MRDIVVNFILSFFLLIINLESLMIKFNIFSNGKLFVSDEIKTFIQSNKNKILFVFHGLYGRARNWQSMAKKLNFSLYAPIKEQ